MRERIRRLATFVVAGSATVAAVTLAAPVANSSPCQVLWSWNPATNECTPPPPGPPATVGRPIPPPPWYAAPPPWAPPWAPPSVPPPPPTPLWAPQDKSPVWDPGHKQWGIWIGPAWVPV